MDNSLNSLPGGEGPSLSALTGHDKGIVLYRNGDLLVCDWAVETQGRLPRLVSGLFLTGTPLPRTVLGQRRSEDLRQDLFVENEYEILYDYNQDIDYLRFTPTPVAGDIFELPDCTIFVPDSWE